MNRTNNLSNAFNTPKTGFPRKRIGGASRRELKLFIFIAVFFSVFMIVEVLMFYRLDMTQGVVPLSSVFDNRSQKVEFDLPPYLLPKVPVLPLFDSIDHADKHVNRLMEGKPSMAGIISLLQNFIAEFHTKNVERRKNDDDGHKHLQIFYETAGKYFRTFDEVYRGKHIFPVRTDGSVFISLIAFREQLLTETMVSAFKNAKNQEKIFVGVVVQNCFGKVLDDGTIDTSGKPCLTGPRKVGKKKNGKPIFKKLDAPPDRNGVEDFCVLPEYKRYCENGQVRVLYVHAEDSLGPSVTRYYASKLWGGENYFMQIDSHVRFASDWDAKYISELKATRNYPKSLLSAYPPGFQQIRFIPKHWNIDLSKINNETVIESPGCRLCNCATPPGEPNPIIHIKQGKSYSGDEPRPTQTPFMGAGFAFFHADFLLDVPYDPYLPWTFMGEEILFSMRAWTSGWNIYAPRKNLILHQYRNTASGEPKFQGTVARQTKKGFGSKWLMQRTIRRIKHLCGYPTDTRELIEADGQGFVLVEKEHYGLGSKRSWDEYMEYAQLTVNHTTGFFDCHPITWCNKGLKD